MSVDNKAVVAKWWDEMWSKGDLVATDELHTADFRDHDPASPWVRPGVEGMKEKVTVYRSAFPDIRFSVSRWVSEGDHVVTHWKGEGTHQGEAFGVAPTGRAIEVEGISIHRLENGRIAEQWIAWDALGLLRQIGAAPEAGDVA